jgi:hypothetical protein
MKRQSIVKNFFGKIFIKEEDPQALLIHLPGIAFPSETDDKNDRATIQNQLLDLNTLEDQLIEVFDKKNIGEFDGNEIGPDESILYMYGPNAEIIFTEIEEILRRNPLCQSSKVVIRYGKPGAPEKEIRIK